MDRTLNTREKGMITVEATVSLTLFLLLCLGVISLINIFVVHSRIQYAMYQAEKELSAYTYLYEATGLRAADLKLKADTDVDRKPIDETVDAVTNFMGQIGKLKSDVSATKQSAEKSLNELSLGNVQETYNSLNGTIEQGQKTYESGKVVAGKAEWIVKNPLDALRGVIAVGVQEGEKALKNWAMSAVAGGLVDKYLEYYDGTGYHSGAEYLSRFGVVAGRTSNSNEVALNDLLSYDKSQMFTDDKYKIMDLVVEYDIEIYFFKLFLNKPTIHVVQKMKMPAWLGGDGVTYRPPSK